MVVLCGEGGSCGISVAVALWCFPGSVLCARSGVTTYEVWLVVRSVVVSW